jgi:hypothetical protein
MECNCDKFFKVLITHLSTIIASLFIVFVLSNCHTENVEPDTNINPNGTIDSLVAETINRCSWGYVFTDSVSNIQNNRATLWGHIELFDFPEGCNGILKVNQSGFNFIEGYEPNFGQFSCPLEWIIVESDTIYEVDDKNAFSFNLTVENLKPNSWYSYEFVFWGGCDDDFTGRGINIVKASPPKRFYYGQPDTRGVCYTGTADTKSITYDGILGSFTQQQKVFRGQFVPKQDMYLEYFGFVFGGGKSAYLKKHVGKHLPADSIFDFGWITPVFIPPNPGLCESFMLENYPQFWEKLGHGGISHFRKDTVVYRSIIVVSADEGGCPRFKFEGEDKTFILYR